MAARSLHPTIAHRPPPEATGGGLTPQRARGPRRIVRVSYERFDRPPWLDTAISRTLLERAAAGLEPETLRLYRPARVLAFGPADRASPGYAAARRAALDAGYTPVERLAGGRAAVFHSGTIGLAWTVPDQHARAGVRERFELAAELIASALRALGVDARVGAVPDEYCPGAYSVNAGGRTKLAGLGQRVLPHAAHIGGVLVVSGAEAIREALAPVYRALALDWDPAAVGSIEQERGPVAHATVVEALARAFGAQFELVEAPVSAEARALALGAGQPLEPPTRPVR
ncbi:MAG: lipoate--protein ligase family protein [Dehalococcoidia bacterium]|nr:lipoate--protein ligase family protein [Dehalococcoidia bacterium]